MNFLFHKRQRKSFPRIARPQNGFKWSENVNQRAQRIVIRIPIISTYLYSIVQARFQPRRESIPRVPIFTTLHARSQQGVIVARAPRAKKMTRSKYLCKGYELNRILRFR